MYKKKKEREHCKAALPRWFLSFRVCTYLKKKHVAQALVQPNESRVC